MAITFPVSPTHGDTFVASGTTFNFDGVKNKWSPSHAPFSANVLPLTDSSLDLGSPDKKWKSLYLSANTMFLGDSGSISAGPGGEISMPAMKIGSGANTIKLGVSATGEFETRKVAGGVVKAAKPSGTNAVTNFSDLAALTDNSAGDTALVTSTKKVYMYDGTGWYLVATMVNNPPGAITGVSDTYNLATDGSATTITAVSVDPEGFPVTWSSAVTAGSLTVVPTALAVAVVNNGSGAYTLSGGVTGDNANVAIKVGQTVNFTVNASGHPFNIRDTNGGAAVSSPAATGQGAVSGVVSWTPNTAGTYYYQCGNHNAMVGTITVTAAAVTATVAQADNVFTITPSTLEANVGTFSLTFNVTDGVNASVSKVSAFTLAFYTYVKPTVNTASSSALATIVAQTANDIEFNFPCVSSVGVGYGYGSPRTHIPSVIIQGSGKVYFEMQCTHHGGYSESTMWTFSRADWSTTPVESPGANGYGWVYSTGFYYSTVSPPAITNAYTDIAANTTERVGVAYDMNGAGGVGEWWFRKNQSAWSWGDPTTAGSGYTSSNAGTEQNYIIGWFTTGSGATKVRRIKFFSKSENTYATPTGYTAV